MMIAIRTRDGSTWLIKPGTDIVFDEKEYKLTYVSDISDRVVTIPIKSVDRIFHY